ncbi:MAG: hypothetical protein QW067_09770 [Thermofilaceae archaeon]
METKHTNLILHDYQKKSFYHALRTKGFVILAGLSGTGKTKIFEEFDLSLFKFNDSLKESIEQFKKIFKNFLDMLDTDLDNPDYETNYDQWKQALDKWTNVWPEEKKEESINIVTLLTDKGFTMERLEQIKDADIKKLKTIVELAYELGITEKNVQPIRKAVSGKYYFFKPYVVATSAEKDDSTEIKDKNIKVIFPELRDILKEIKDRKPNKLGSSVINLFKIIQSNEETFSEKELRDLLQAAIMENFKTFSEKELRDKLARIIENFFERVPLKKLFLPVRPDFKDSKSLLGYYNPLKGKYQKTELLEFILEAQREYIRFGKSALPYLVLLDEMNLARVEYYFADFLSVLESKRIEKERDVNDEMLKNIKDENNNPVSEKKKLIGFYSKPIILHNEDLPDVPQKLYLPPNLYFIGSVNIDETTYMFSPKVLDRAFTIEFDADLKMYLKEISNQNKTVNQEDIKLSDFTRNGKFAVIEKKYVDYMAKKKIQKLGKSYGDILDEIFLILKPYGLHFGYRVINEIMMFLYNATEDTNANYKMDEIEALDLAIKMKILPKFHGTRQKLENPIKKLIKYCERADKDFAESDNQPDYLSPKKIPNLIKESNTNRFKLELDDREFLFPHTACKLIEMLYKLQTQGFASFL